MAEEEENIAASSDERLRNFEILRYGRSVHFQKVHAASSQYENTTIPIDWSAGKLSFSTTLTALCQLVALRMNTKRAFISLVDGTDLHVLAEATRTVSLYDASIHDATDGLMFGTQNVKYKYGITSVTFPAFLANGEKHWFHSDVSISDSSKYVITNILEEPRVKHIPFARDHNTNAFYVEVPLRTSRGRTVGTVVVLDDTPRTDPAAVNVLPMQDVARVVIEHLELAGLKDLNSRAERLMQGLASFNRRPSVTQDNLTGNVKSDAEHELRASPSQSRDGLPIADTSTLINKRSIESLGFPSRLVVSRTGSTSKPTINLDSNLLTATLNDIAYDDSPVVAHRSVLENGRKDIPITQASDRILESVVLDPDALVASSMVNKQQSITEVFVRASNLIREAMDLEAVCFMEPSSDEPIYRREPKQISVSSSDSLLSSERQETSRSHTSDSERGTGTSQDEETSVQNSGKLLCTHLAFSSKQKPDSIRAQETQAQFRLSNSSLQRLAGLYPEGYIFQFDAFGVLSSGDEVASNSNTKRLSQRREAARAIKKAFPEARSLLFMPLYNNDQQFLYAALCAWTTDSARVLSQSDSIYVSGFAHSIMCEILRLEALALDRAKSDFMSSMSHELRSPLHGIIAATHLLQGTDMSVEQDELASMVDDCGRTLLDIMNNVLEHAKINQSEFDASQTKKTKKRKDRASDEEGKLRVSQTTRETVNLAKLLEETVVSVAAGHSVKEQRNAQFGAKKLPVLGPSKGEPNGDGLYTDIRPPVLLHIQHRSNWDCLVDAGAWRRIVMNLVGNSLKYTAEGHILVSLYAQSAHKSHARRSSMEVVLEVTDTGQGISQSYMKHRLYTPFSQENNLSVGAGLGLSIVSRLVASMKGSIRLNSEVNKGSTFIVTLPIGGSLDDAPGKTLSLPSEKLDLAAQAVCLIGFGVHNIEAISSPHKSTSEIRTLEELGRSLEEMLTKWCSISVTNDLEKATIFVIEEATASAMLQKDPNNEVFRRKYIITDPYDHTHIRKNHWKGFSRVISAPIGPFKLLKAMSALLSDTEPEFWSIHSAANLNQTSIPNQSQHIGHRQNSPSATEVSEHASRIPSSPATLPNPPTQLTATRLLLVDDNDINLRILGSFVKKLKLQYELARDGQEAVDSYITACKIGRPFRVVFMDISMPVMDGITATRQIRAYEKENGVSEPTEIIALTGLGHMDTRRDAMASGVDQYFCKPVKLDLLREILREMLVGG